jgi:hypothetical protein
VLGCELRDLWKMAHDPLVIRHKEGVGATAASGREGAGEVAGPPDFEPLDLNAEHAGCITHALKCVSRGLENGDPHGTGDGALEVLQPLRVEVVGVCEPGEVSTRPGVAGDEAFLNRIDPDVEEYGNRGGRRFGRTRGGRPTREDEIHSELDQLSREGRKPIELRVGKSGFEDEVAAFLVAEGPQRCRGVRPFRNERYRSRGRLPTGKHPKPVDPSLRWHLGGERRRVEAHGEGDGDRERGTLDLHVAPFTSA